MRGSLLHAPDTYMEKIAVGGAYPEGVVDIDRRPEENIEALAHAKGVKPNDISACILDRPRHADLIEAVRSTGAAVHLITDGDVAGVIHTTNPEETGIDIYMGIGGAPEGVLAAAALRCTGGQMQGRLRIKSAGAEGARDEDRACGFREEAHAARHGFGRCHLRGDGRHRRIAAQGRALRQAVDGNGNRGHALGQRHDPLDQEPQEE